MDKIYFDNAATTQIDSAVVDRIQNIMLNNYGNPILPTVMDVPLEL